MAKPEQDAAQWLPAARAGSSEALGQALEACRGYLLLIAQREMDPVLRAKGGASDLVQETFLKAQRAFSGFEGDTEDALLAWLRQMLLNTMADFQRLYRQTDKRQVSREVALKNDSSTGGPTPEPSADVSTPSAHAMKQEQGEVVKQAMARLPEDYRQVLTLRYQDELSFEEIGERMGRTGNAARKLWVRALEKLQQELDGLP